MHVHAPVQELNPLVASRARIILAVIVLPLVMASLLGMFLLWPGDKAPIGRDKLLADGARLGVVKVTSLNVHKCIERTPSFGSELENKASDAGTATGIDPTALLKDGVCGEVLSGVASIGVTLPVYLPPEVRPSIQVGSTLRVVQMQPVIDESHPLIFWEVSRAKTMALLGLLYVVLVVAVAGRRGARALVGLIASTAVLGLFVLPALMAGKSPILVTLVGASVMMFLSVYFAHGVSIRTTTALLGTFIGLVITVLLAYWGTWFTGITGTGTEHAATLITRFPGLYLPALFASGAVIAGLGALNDVTITQASSVWELNSANPKSSKLAIFKSAMAIGKDHIASTVYTLAFAYAGTALPTLMLALLIQRNYIELLTVSEIAEEVVRTLVASIGLVVAIPATTLIAVILVKVSNHRLIEHH